MEERLLAYIDILGFSSAILNGSEDVKNNATFLIQKLYHFDQNRECLIQNQSIQDGSVYQRMSLEITAVSDSIIISTPYPKTYDHLTFVLTKLCRYTAKMQAEILEIGFLSRGGITSGKLLHQSSLIVGEAICKAVDLEKDIGKKFGIPAVIIDEKLVTEFLEIGRNDYRKSVARFPDHIHFDVDYYLDQDMSFALIDKHLNHYFVNYLRMNFDRCNYFENITRVISDSLASEKLEDKMKQKWKWAAERFNENVRYQKSAFCSLTLKTFPNLKEINY